MDNTPTKFENFYNKLVKNQNKYLQIQVIFFSIQQRNTNLKIFAKK